jgi:hypothetical protein
MTTFEDLPGRIPLAHACRRLTRELGPGFPEAVREEAREMALRERGTRFEARKSFVG